MAENEKLNNVAVDNDVGTMEDVDAIMKKYDRESNTRVWEGTPRKILRVLTALFGILLIVMNMWIKMDERARRPLFLGLVIILVFIYYPIKKVHNDPMHAWCDGAQSLNPEQFADLAQKMRVVREAVTQ